jgi:tRNA nucleotidyltransferase/poly(A) polymerase
MMTNSLLRNFTSISLTEREKKVFDALMAASISMSKGTVLRAAGGWVRDKLMDKESTDIDIALDNVPGDEFAMFVYDREKARGHVSSVGVVRENPAQSKHIRTASFRFFDLDIDVNNLRSETYTEDSRIPEVTFAKHPSEDALRRDFTINSLYYNINTREVEDFTGHGLSDLDAGLIRTPLDAHRTFVDDPLRVLRAVRFASRFNFKLHEDIERAWSTEDVRSGLMNKVSRERIGTEISLMMENKNAYRAISLLQSSGIMDLVLHAPDDEHALSLAGVSKKHYSDWKAMFEGRKTKESIGGYSTAESLFENMKIFGEGTLSFPHFSIFNFALLVYPVLQQMGPLSDSSLVYRLSMKLSNDKCKGIAALVDNVGKVWEAVKDTTDQLVVARALGRIIRTSLKGYAREGVFFALVTCDTDTVIDWNHILDILNQYDLLNCHTWKPVVDGSELQKEFGIPPSAKLQELLSVEFDIMFTGERNRDRILDALRVGMGVRG